LVRPGGIKNENNKMHTMKFYDFFVKHTRVRNVKDLLILLVKLAVILFIAGEIYGAVRYFICFLSEKHLQIKHVIFYLKQIILIFIIYVLYRCAKHFQKKGTLKKAILFFIILSVITSYINGSILGIFFWDGPYWGRVVDADTGEPIAGAYVMGRWEFESIIPLPPRPMLEEGIFADVRETVSDEKGRFFLPIARIEWFWPFSWIKLEELSVYKPGYDSHPPRMQYAWKDKDKEKWLDKLNRKYPEARKKDIQDAGRSIYQMDYFFNPNYVSDRYARIYRVNCKFYKPSVIKLNKALSFEEQREAASIISLSGVGCEGYKISRIKNDLYRKKGRFPNVEWEKRKIPKVKW
jgi:hypothetical protein